MKMRHFFFYTILAFAAILSISYWMNTPAHEGMRLMDMGLTAAEPEPLPSPEEDSLVSAELKYYFDRHNVQDEGYEMVAAFAAGQRLRVEITPRFSAFSVGEWKNRQPKGTCVRLDSLGRTIIGTWLADSTATGIRQDSTGTYMGDFRDLKADGHGAYYSIDGSYMEGHWADDRQQGFGIELLTPQGEEPRLRAGEWTKGKFQGERMRYTTERIYGIDIAKYQHGKGRRALPIRWDQLRITHVGKRGNQNVSGTADYPVSFVYIKSTEGTSIRNRFYRNDYLQARKRGVRAGAYHFWSVRTGGQQQADFFLKHTLFRDGDLPPVLDIEPSKAQIQQMGGEEKMFRHIRTWLKAVERRTGVKPILYANQLFVNNYLSKQTDLKRNYRVWIARYSEYKPDVRLTFWQLCPDGRVKGIHGEVDINVFNGYQSQFEEFLENETIKK